MSTVADSLGIFWQGAEEVGINLYAFHPGEIGASRPFPLHLWPLGTEIGRRPLFGTGWRVEGFLLRLHELPEPVRWSAVVRESLFDLVVRGGATVAWCGMEGGFSDPPELFAPRSMADSVWAACSAAASHDAPPLDAEMRYLDEAALMRLHAEVEAARSAELASLGPAWPPRELWVTFDYAGFWDVPLCATFVKGYDRIVLDRPFNDVNDDYETEYGVYLLDRRVRDLEHRWPGVEGGLEGARRLGSIEVRGVRYDESTRKRIDIGIDQPLGRLLAAQGIFER